MHGRAAGEAFAEDIGPGLKAVIGGVSVKSFFLRILFAIGVTAMIALRGFFAFPGYPPHTTKPAAA